MMKDATEVTLETVLISVLNVGVVAKKPSVAAELALLGEGVHSITIVGRLLTNVIKRDGKEPEYRTQVEVDEIRSN